MRSLLLALVIAAPIAAQQPAHKAPPAAMPAPSLPNDTAVHTGKLANGLRYWVRHNEYPEHRLELRLVVRAGAVLEDDDQRGLAHFIEHMGFNGTTHFARNELVKYLESIGVRFGADLNAETGFDETTYILPVPSDKPELVKRAFDILSDWAGGDKFQPDAIEHERGVIMGEWREGLGADSRIRDQEIPILFQGSRYAKRLPIGDTTTIMHANAALLQRFYHDWYRPDLMAVIAVGDYPVDSLKALITQDFGALKNPVPQRARVDAAIPLIPGTRAVIMTDPEVTTESIQLLVRRPVTAYHTVADERRNIINALLGSVASQRMIELARKPDAPFTGAGFGPSGFIRNLQAFDLDVDPKEGKSAQAFEATLRELRRFQQHGVLPAELDRAKASFLRGREGAAAETGKTESANFLGSYTGAFLYGNATLSAQQRFVLAQQLVPQITVTEVNAAIRDIARGTDRFIALEAPEKLKGKLPTRDTLMAILARTDTATMSPWVDSTVTTALVPHPPTPGHVVSENTVAALGITEWTLSNGIRVVIKPTDFKKDQVYMVGEGLGGTSLLSDDQLMNGEFAASVVGVSGVGDFDALSLRRKLAGKIAQVFPKMDETSESLALFTAPNDLESGLQMFWLYATEPRLDSAAVKALIEGQRTGLANRDADPSTVFSDTINAVLWHGDPRHRELTLARLDELDARKAVNIYRDWFHDFSGFAFAIVGNVDLKTLRPLVEQWIGGLPTGGVKRTWRNVAATPVEGVVNKVVHKGKEPVAEQVIFFNGPAAVVDAESSLAGEAAAEILQERLLDSLRQGMGATYGAEVNNSLDRFPTMRYQSVIGFKSTPQQADTLWQAAQRIITALRTTGPTTDELQKFVEQARRESEVEVKTNEWWLSAISSYLYEDGPEAGRPMTEMLDWNKRLQALTPAMVQDAAKKFFEPTRVARFVLVPE